MSLSPGEIGRIGERLARNHLEARGYHIVDANFQCRWGEVDLVARDGVTWVFVEVRTRRSERFGTAQESVTASKARRLTLTALVFFEQRGLADGDPDWRIDLIAIRLGNGRRVASICHLQNAVEG